MNNIKKILIILIFILLTSCSLPSNLSTGQEGNNIKIEGIVVDEFEAEKTYEDEFKNFNEEIEKNNSWIFEGSGEYARDVEDKTIKTSGNSSLTSPNIYLKEGRNYTITFDISSDVDTSINVYINSENGQLTSQTISTNSTNRNYSINLYCDVTAYEVKTRFEFNDSGTYKINNFSISSDIRNNSVRINQVGYLTNLSKKAIMPIDQGDYFTIYDENNNILYNGPISTIFYNKDSNENLQKCYFSNFKQKGKFYIKTELGTYSNEFIIGDDVYDKLAKDALNFLYTQRCGEAINSNEVYHDACHTADTKLFTTLSDTYFDTVGGWHDASDFGRYIQSESKVISDLFFAYLYTNDNSQDVIDEAKYGLNWLLKCQKSDGSVYNKITTKTFAGDILPEYDNETMYAMWSWTLTTASFAGTTGLAYKIFKDSDEKLAEKCLQAHQNAINFLINNKSCQQDLNPSDFSTGEYPDNNEDDERLYAYAVAYDISKDEIYLNLCNEVVTNGLNADSKSFNCKVFAIITLMDCLEKNSDLYRQVESTLRSECDSYSDKILNEAYSYAYNDYNWGSSAHECNACAELLLGYYIFADEKYLVAASKAIDYVLGLNSLNMCFVYGYGNNYPKTIHHRVANARGTTITGALAGGVDQFLSEGNSGNYINEETPKAKRFVDAQDCYTNIEPAIYYNSPLVLALQLLIDANNDLNK